MLISRFLDCYYKQIKEKGLNKVVTAPSSMIIDNISEDGWYEWKPAPSNIDIAKVKKQYKIKIPSEYKEFIKNRQFMNIEISSFTLYGINEINTLEKNIDLLPSKLINQGFLSIGVLNNENYLVLNTKDNIIIEMSYDDYSIKNNIQNSFYEFIEFLLIEINC